MATPSADALETTGSAQRPSGRTPWLGMLVDLVFIGAAAGCCWWLSHESWPLTIIVGGQLLVVWWFIWRITGATPGTWILTSVFGIGSTRDSDAGQTSAEVQQAIEDHGFGAYQSVQPWHETGAAQPTTASRDAAGVRPDIPAGTADAVPAERARTGMGAGTGVGARAGVVGPGIAGPAPDASVASRPTAAAQSSARPPVARPASPPVARPASAPPAAQTVSPQPPAAQQTSATPLPEVPQRPQSRHAYPVAHQPAPVLPPSSMHPGPALPKGPVHPGPSVQVPAAHDPSPTVFQRPAPQSEPESVPESIDDTHIAEKVEVPAAPTQLLLPDGRSEQLAGRMLVGRKPSADNGEQVVTIADDQRSISRTHFAIDVIERAVLLTDLGSANGTRLHRDGHELTLSADSPVALLPGDEIRIGRFTLELR